MEDKTIYRAIVEKIIPKGKHGPYAVARCDGLGTGTVTFSLTPKVWPEKESPEPGMYVVLSEVRKKRAGWRAQNVRFLKPSDENQQTASERSI
jgi:hypothetical protein